MSARSAWIALSAVSGLGPARFRTLIEAFGSPEDALTAGSRAVGDVIRLPDSALAEIDLIPSRLQIIESELLSLEDAGVWALTWEDGDYPTRLLATASPPPVLWWKSGCCPTQPDAAVAVVGSREVSEAGLSAAEAIGSAFAEAGIAVISGLAAGIDAAAHEGSLRGGGPTVGVCGCGLAAALTRGGDGLASRVAEGGAICSELSPTAPLTPRTLFARDRIIAGLADAVVVVEAREEGGAVDTAKCARRDQRPVVAVAWPAGHTAPGNSQLLAQGAIGVSPDADLVGVFAEITGG